MILLLLAACAPAAAPPASEQIAPPSATLAAPAPQPTSAPAPTAAEEPAVSPTRVVQPTATAAASPQPATEAPLTHSVWLSEFSAPTQLDLRDTASIRLHLIPQESGYSLQIQDGQRQETQTLQIGSPPNSDLEVHATLQGAAFEISPNQTQSLQALSGQPIAFVWTIQPRRVGQHSLSLQVTFRWTARDNPAAAPRAAVVYARGINIAVDTWWLRYRGTLLGVAALTAALIAAAWLSLRPRARLTTAPPNPNLQIEAPPETQLSRDERTLLQTLFRQYARLSLQTEFLSGYSGARTFLAQPLHPNGRADAPTIVKIGSQSSITAEYSNYQRFVRDTLPPLTARIQHPPVRLPRNPQAAVRYTFIATPNQPPRSLRQTLLQDPDPTVLQQLFATFAPNWWMQRQPYTFRWAQEYDVLLPTHLVLTAEETNFDDAQPLSERALPMALNLPIGTRVRLGNFPKREWRADQKSLSLEGFTVSGQPPLRVRWLSTHNPHRAIGKIVATRASLLHQWVKDFPLYGLPDPTENLSALLNRSVQGTRAIIHGDLNVENVLLGPGGAVWLIDFAQTRESHPLLDFAHLYAEIVAHILAEQITAPEEFLRDLQANAHPLLTALDEIAARCLFDAAHPQEWHTACLLGCLGALKYTNLNDHARHLLYLSAAWRIYIIQLSHW